MRGGSTTGVCRGIEIHEGGRRVGMMIEKEERVKRNRMKTEDWRLCLRFEGVCVCECVCVNYFINTRGHV